MNLLTTQIECEHQFYLLKKTIELCEISIKMLNATSANVDLILYLSHFSWKRSEKFEYLFAAFSFLSEYFHIFFIVLKKHFSNFLLEKKSVKGNINKF